jgi:hypothetical protein
MKTIKPTRQEQVKVEMKKYLKKYLYTIRGKVNVETKYINDKKKDRSYLTESVPILKQIMAINFL